MRQFEIYKTAPGISKFNLIPLKNGRSSEQAVASVEIRTQRDTEIFLFGIFCRVKIIHHVPGLKCQGMWNEMISL